MKYGIHYAYWQQQWAADIRQCCLRAAKLGFDVLEISGDGMLSCSKQQLAEIKATAEELNLSVYPCQGMPKSCDPGAEDPACRQGAIDFAKRMFDSMGELGCKQLGGILYSYWPTLDYSNRGESVERAWELSLQTTKRIAQEAASRSIQLNFEVVNRYENYLFNDTKTALKYLDELGCDNVKLLLDIFHMNIEEDSIGDAIRLAGSRLGHFHIGECNRKVPGRGHMPWQEIAGALKDIGYDAAITMEPFVRAGGEVADAVRVWHDLAEPGQDVLDRDLTSALSFTKSLFA